MVERVSRTQKLKAASGIALVEILIAILILGSAFTIILSLQSSALQSVLHDRNQQQAMLQSRSILSLIENNIGEIENTEITGTVREVMTKISDQAPPEPDRQKDTQDNAENAANNLDLQANLVIQDFELPIPKVNEVTIRKVFLRVFWGNGPREYIETVLYLPGKSGEADEES